MADSKVTALGTISDLADGDLVYVVDVSDTTDDAAGSSKGITAANLISTLHKEYASFYQSTGGVTGLSSTAVTLNLASTQQNSDGTIFSLSSNTVTVNKTGTFLVNMDNYINNSSTSRTEYSLWLERNSSEIAGTRHAVYERGYDSGGSTSMTTIISITSGDVFRMRIQRTDGGATAGYQDSNGTRLTFVEL